MAEPRLRHDVLRAPLGDEEVLLSTTTGQYHKLNETGRAVLAALDDGSSIDEVVERLATASAVEPDQVRADVEAFLAALRQRGLVENP